MKETREQAAIYYSLYHEFMKTVRGHLEAAEVVEATIKKGRSDTELSRTPSEGGISESDARSLAVCQGRIDAFKELLEGYEEPEAADPFEGAARA
jgi:hypothetical protein